MGDEQWLDGLWSGRCGTRIGIVQSRHQCDFPARDSHCPECYDSTVGGRFVRVSDQFSILCTSNVGACTTSNGSQLGGRERPKSPQSSRTEAAEPMKIRSNRWADCHQCRPGRSLDIAANSLNLSAFSSRFGSRKSKHFQGRLMLSRHYA